ncbi:cadherin domain-containing protein [Rhizobium sp. 2MFCol3.1]|uniref:T1SS-143 repeat domain-containing protein n=1 Tax=Rhizobium sp. 2MFCol3.1 TaxID=1246459 RepID=UPI00036B9FEC|nr:cadherin domain-containing protein [Rhizobium sp. 2MFCol3.1]
MSIEDSRISVVENENASHDLISDIHQDARLQTSARDGVEVAQADTTQPADQQGAQSTETTGRLPAAQEAAAAAPAGQVVPDQNNIAHLPAGTAIDDIHVRGNDLVLVQADGTEIVIVNGALHVPTFLLGEVELPQQAVIAALEQSNINVAAGPDGSYSASSSPSSSGANFQDTTPGNGGAPTQLASLLADTQQPDFTPERTPDLNNDTPTALANAVVLLDDSSLPGGNGEATLLNTTGTLGFLSGNDGIGSVLLTGAGLATSPAGEGSFFQAVGADGRSIVISQVQHGTNVTVLTVTLSDTTSGIYTIVQNAAIQHAAGQGENTQAFTIGYQVKDQDGDIANGTLTLNVKDDVIAWSPSEDSNTTVDEHNLGNGGETPVLLREAVSSSSTTASGDLHISWGADNYDVAGANDGVGRSLVFASAAGDTSAQVAAMSAVDANGETVALTSNGIALTYSLSDNGTTLVATAEGQPIFTVTLNDDGSGTYEFTLTGPLDNKFKGTDALTLTFHTVATDSDGDAVPVYFSVAVADDIPVNPSDATLSVDEHNLASGAIEATGHVSALAPGADGYQGGSLATAIHFTTVPSDLKTTAGVAIDVTQSGNVLTGKVHDTGAIAFTLTVNADGTYKYVQNVALSHPTQGTDVKEIGFGFTITDGDGDVSAPATITVKVTDDVAAPNQIADATANHVGEMALTTKTPADNTITGSLIDGNAGDGEINFGADGYKTGSLAFDGIAGQPAVTSHGDTVRYVLSGNTLYGYVSPIALSAKYVSEHSGVQVFKVVLDPATASYSFTLLKPLDHVKGDDLSLGFKLTAQDGDTDAVKFTLNLHVDDANPVGTQVNDVNTTIDEHAILTGNPLDEVRIGSVVEGFLSNGAVDFGPDGYKAGSLSFGALVNQPQLTSGGAVVHYVVVGNTLYGYVGADPQAGHVPSQGSQVFTLSLAPALGGYVFELKGAIDHLGDDAVAKELSFALTGKDYDGDTVNIELQFHIKDDIPTIGAPTLGHAAEVGSSQILANGTFEHDSLATGPKDVHEDSNGNYSYNAPTGWTITGGVGGLFAPATSIVSAEGHDGGNVVWLREGATLAKDTGTTLAAGQVYSLHFDVGNRSDQAFGGGVAKLIATNGNQTVVLSEVTLTEPADGKWGSVDLNSPVIGSDYAGWQLRVEITQTSGTGDQILIDDVELRQFTPSVATGSLGISWGADNNVDLRGVTFDAQQPTGLTSNGDAIHYTLSANNTLLTAISADGRTIFTVELSKTTGQYKLTLIDTLDHQSIPQGGLQFAFTATDADGDPTSSHFTVIVADDKPVLSNADGISQALLSESGIVAVGTQPAGTDAGHGNVASGNLAVNFGADGFGSTAFAGGFTVNGGASGSLVAGGAGVDSGLTSDKRPVFFSLSSDAHTIEGRTASGEVVLRAVLNQGDAGWKVTLLGNIDHQPGNAGRGADQALSFTVVAKDGDGDSVNLTLSTTIHDDKPVIAAPVDTGHLAESGLPFVSVDSGSLHVNLGADNKAANHVEIGLDTDGNPVINAGLTSDRIALEYLVRPTNGGDQEIVAFKHGESADNPVFIVSVVRNGTFVATLFQNLDHAPGSDTLTLNLVARVYDGDGDYVDQKFSVVVADSQPTITGPLQNVNLLSNGDFTGGTWAHTADWGAWATESTGWKIEGTAPGQAGVQLEKIVGTYFGLSGANSHPMVDLGASPGNIAISQSVAGLTAGDKYTISFQVGSHDPDSSALEVHWNDKVYFVPVTAEMKVVSLDVTAGSGSNTLTFKEVGNPDDNTGTYLANISLTHGAAVPVFTGATVEDSGAIKFNLHAGTDFNFGADEKGSVNFDTTHITISTPSGTTITLPTTAYSYDDKTGVFTINPGYSFDGLSEGEVAKITIPFTVTDGDGDSKSAVYQLTVTGKNDIVRTSEGFPDGGTITEYQATDPRAGSTTDRTVFDNAPSGASGHNGGGFYIYDDQGDKHSLTISPGGTGYFGTLTAVVTEETANDGRGWVDWKYHVDDATLNKLAEGETRTEVFRVTVDDGHGSTTFRDITVKLVGTNDKPVFDIVDPAKGSVIEDTTPTATGTIAFTDADLIDTHTATVTAPQGPTYGTFTLGAVTESATTAGGSVGWTYKLNSSAEALAEGDIRTETYKVTINDGHGGVITKDVTITITGTNDAAVIGGTTTGSVTEDVATINTSAPLYKEDFSSDSSASGWGKNALVQTRGFSQHLSENNFGDYDGRESISKTITLAPAGSAGPAVAQIEFDFIKIDSWDRGEQLKVYLNNGMAFAFTPKNTGNDGLDGTTGTFTVGGITGTYVITSSGVDTQMGGSGLYLDRIYHISIIAEGVGNKVTLGFGNTLNEHYTNEDFGIDNIVIRDATAGQLFTQGNLTVVDVDHDQSAFIAQQATAGKYGTFTLDTAGHWTYTADNANPDIQALKAGASTVDSFTVQSIDGTSKIVTVTINGTNDAPTAIALSNNTVDENDAGAIIGKLTTTDKDVGDTHTYTVSDDRFEVVDGSLKLKNNVSLDYEAKHSIDITVTSKDSGNLTTSQTFTIQVGDVNEKPTTPIDSNKSNNTIAEGAANGTTVGITANATDPDGDQVRYSLADDAGGRFKIDANSGVVTVANASLINYEDARSHTITVLAYDGRGESSTQTFTINVTNVAPSGLADTDSSNNTVAEGAANGTVVGITANATDVNGGTVTYSLSDSASGRFAIDSTTGVVTVANGAQLNYESATSHSITVVASDPSGATTSKTFIIGVSNVAPSTPIDSNTANNTVAEGAATGTTVGITASAADVNGGTVTYSLVDNAGGRFAISSTTGVVTVANGALLDYETATSHSIVVKASDPSGAFTTQTFTIDVGNVAPSTPTDTSSAANTVLEGAANGTLVGITASATDVNGGTVTYSLADDAGGRFAIDGKTGVVTVANGALLDYETATSHSIVVKASDPSGLYAAQTFVIAVGNVAPSAPVDADTTNNTVAENAANGTLVGITASSSDVNGGTITYTLTNDAQGRFKIDSTTGVVSVANGTLLDYETATSHTITVKAADAAGAFTTKDFTINISDVYEGPVNTAPDAGGPVKVITGNTTTAIPDWALLHFARDADGDTLKITGASATSSNDTASHTGNVTQVTFKDGGQSGGSFSYVVSDGSPKDTDTGSASVVRATGPLIGSAGAEIIIASNNGTTIDGKGGDDIIIGGSGDDVIYAYNGMFKVDGGAGSDTLQINGDKAIVDLSSTEIVNVEKLVGQDGGKSDYNQTVTLSATQWAGFSSINMNDGTDTVNVKVTGNMDISGASSTSVNGVEIGHLVGSDGNDTITLTGAQLNSILVGSGDINLGSGIDTINLTSTSSDLNNLDDNSLKGVEVISASSATSGVTINLSSQSEGFTIVGGSGGDTLVGGNGNDIIIGGGGADIMTGGTGADIFRIAAGDSKPSIELSSSIFSSSYSVTGYDQITDFDASQDKIELPNSGSLKIAADVSKGDFADVTLKETALFGNGASSTITGHSIVNGVVTFKSGNGNGVVPINSMLDLAVAVKYLQALGDNTIVAFKAMLKDDGSNKTVEHTFLFEHQTGSDYTLVDLKGYSLPNDGLKSLFGTTTSAIDPIILDLDHNGVALTTLEHGVSFDINADGHQDKIAWTAGTDGILAYDVDGNGKIDNGSEIFSPHFAGGNYVDGLQALATLDSNHDGKIDANDEAFSKLLVWQDLNHNGISDAGELSSLADHQIASLSLDAHASDSAINGQAILADGSYTLTDGSTGHFVEVAFDATLGSADDNHAYSLIGSDGDDILSGAGGMYTLTGGAGADTFVLDADALSDVKIADVITDYKAGEGDTLDVSKLLDSLLGHQSTEAEALSSVKTTVQGADTVVSVNANGGWHDVAVLQNTTEAVKILFDDKHDTTTAPHVG